MIRRGAIDLMGVHGRIGSVATKPTGARIRLDAAKSIPRTEPSGGAAANPIRSMPSKLGSMSAARLIT